MPHVLGSGTYWLRMRDVFQSSLAIQEMYQWSAIFVSRQAGNLWSWSTSCCILCCDCSNLHWKQSPGEHRKPKILFLVTRWFVDGLLIICKSLAHAVWLCMVFWSCRLTLALYRISCFKTIAHRHWFCCMVWHVLVWFVTNFPAVRSSYSSKQCKLLITTCGKNSICDCCNLLQVARTT